MFLSNLRHYSYILSLCLFSLFLPFIITGPISVSETFYQKSIDSLQDKNCKMPAEISLPFKFFDDSIPFSYLSDPLKQCKIEENVKENDGVYHFCKEIFDVIKNITCSDYNSTLPKIESTRGSKEVCKDFKDMKDVFPKQKDYFSGKLEDESICQVLCLRDFESLCKVLLWLYDIQVQIQNASKSVAVKDENVEINSNVTNEDTTFPKVTTNDVKQEPLIDSEVQDDKNESFHVSITAEDKSRKNTTTGLGLKSTKTILPISNTSVSSPPSSKIDINNQDPENVDNVISSNKKIIEDAINRIQNESKETNITTQDNVHMPLIPKINNNFPKSIDPINFVIRTTTDKNKQNFTVTTPVTRTNKNNTSVANNVQINTLSKSIQPLNVRNNMLNNDFQGVENESKLKGKPSDMKHSIVSNEKKISVKQTDMDVGDSGKTVTGTEFAVIQISVGNNADEEQDNKDEEQYYNDTENNEGDYPKSEYENISNIGKVKKVDMKNAVTSEVVSSNDFSSNYDGFINARSNAAHEPDSIQMVSTFPEQEDSHFFFYFLSIVLILMSGYLIFHNKQKIIALIVEGRHERRRRSHGVGYKKLETK